MAKKKVKKEPKETKSGTQFVSTECAIVECINEISKLHNRIDAIVSAIDKSKTVRGL